MSFFFTDIKRLLQSSSFFWKYQDDGNIQAPMVLTKKNYWAMYVLWKTSPKASSFTSGEPFRNSMSALSGFIVIRASYCSCSMCSNLFIDQRRKNTKSLCPVHCVDGHQSFGDLFLSSDSANTKGQLCNRTYEYNIVAIRNIKKLKKSKSKAFEKTESKFF